MTGPPREPGHPDLRLICLAVGVWSSAFAALYLPALAAFGAAAVAGVAAGALLVIAPKCCTAGWAGPLSRQTALRMAAAVLLGVCMGAAATAARVAQRDAEPLAGLVRDRASVRVELVVSDDPRPVRGGVAGSTSLAVPSRLVLLWTDEVRLASSARLLVLATDRQWSALLPGQRVAASGRLGVSRGGDLRAAILSAGGAPVRLGGPPWIQRAAGRLRTGLQRACDPLPAEPGGLLPGLVIGDTSTLPAEVAEDFRTAGLTHVMPRTTRVT